MSGIAFPGADSNASSTADGFATDIASIGAVNIGGSQIGINFNTNGSNGRNNNTGANGLLTLGTIQMTATASKDITLGQSASAGPSANLAFTGNTIGSFANTVLANFGGTSSATRTLTLASYAGGSTVPMRLVLNNTTNVVQTSQYGNITVSSVVAQASGVTAGIIKEGAGILTLSGINTFTGGITINAGTVSATSFNSLVPGPAAIAPIIIINGGTLRTTGNTSNDNLNRQIGIGNTGGAIETANATTFTMSARIRNATGATTGLFAKTGGGKLLLTNGLNNFTGPTAVRAGTLAIGAADSTGAAVGSTSGLTIGDTDGNTYAGVLAGYGSVNPSATVSVNNNGTITAGTGAATTDTPGLLTTGGQVWNAGGKFTAKFKSSTGTAGTVGGWDQLEMGNLNLSSLGGGNLFKIVAVLGTGGTFVPPAEGTGTTSYTLAHAAGLTSPAPVDLTTIFDLDTSGLGVPASSGTFAMSIVSDGGTGFNVNLDYSPAPEPTTAALFGLGGMTLLGYRRRRRAVAAAV